MEVLKYSLLMLLAIGLGVGLTYSMTFMSPLMVLLITVVGIYTLYRGYVLDKLCKYIDEDQTGLEVIMNYLPVVQDLKFKYVFEQADVGGFLYKIHISFIVKIISILTALITYFGSASLDTYMMIVFTGVILTIILDTYYSILMVRTVGKGSLLVYLATLLPVINVYIIFTIAWKTVIEWTIEDNTGDIGY